MKKVKSHDGLGEPTNVFDTYNCWLGKKKAEIRAPGADFAKKRRVAGFLSHLARSAPDLAGARS